MKHTYCVACGSESQLHQHHLVPRSLGGSSTDTNFITLCVKCHGLIHGLDISIEKLTKKIVTSNAFNELEKYEAQQYAESLRDVVEEFFNSTTHITIQRVADHLNKLEHKTIEGRRWTITSTNKLLKRLGMEWKKTRGRKPYKQDYADTTLGTARQYSIFQRRYIDWCNSRKREPVPATIETLVAFINEYQFQSKHELLSTMSAISRLHRDMGYNKPISKKEIKEAKEKRLQTFELQKPLPRNPFLR